MGTRASNADAAFFPGAELLARYRRKELSPVEVVRAVLDRIDPHDGAMNAFCWVDGEGALASASAIAANGSSIRAPVLDFVSAATMFCNAQLCLRRNMECLDA